MSRACSTHGAREGNTHKRRITRLCENNIKCILHRRDVVVSTGLIWLRIGISGGLLQIR
jgi:hypothetical protein